MKKVVLRVICSIRQWLMTENNNEDLTEQDTYLVICCSELWKKDLICPLSSVGEVFYLKDTNNHRLKPKYQWQWPIQHSLPIDWAVIFIVWSLTNYYNYPISSVHEPHTWLSRITITQTVLSMYSVWLYFLIGKYCYASLTISV